MEDREEYKTFQKLWDTFVPQLTMETTNKFAVLAKDKIKGINTRKW